MTEPLHPGLANAFASLMGASTAQPPALSLAATDELKHRFDLSRRQIEIAALRAGLLPERYRRNFGTVGWEGQIRLLEATVGIVGAGGLGGWIIEGLARMGLGRLIIIDGDVFEENNLNRQAGCTEAALGRSKAAVMAERVAQVNRTTETVVHVTWLDSQNAGALLDGSLVIVDALDSLPARITLQHAAQAMGVPLVHGAIAGYSGQVMIIYPEDVGLASIYGPGPYPQRGVETLLGNPTATPMMVAAWEIQQVVKYLVGSEKGLLRNRLLMLDAQAGDTLLLNLGGPEQE